MPLSDAARAIRAYVRQPLHLRSPVGFNIEFLEQYHPNHTFYLSASMRQQLRSMGRIPDSPGIPAGTFVKDILGRLLIDLSWASSVLEGNAYSLLEAERLIRQGQLAEGRDAREAQMILNHKQAIEYLTLPPQPPELTAETILALHALLADSLIDNPLAVGATRQCAVGISGSVFLPLGVPQSLGELLGLVLEIARDIQDPFEQAFFLMVHIPYLQPFEDVNKRVSRLAANIPFLRQGLCPLSFVDVPQQIYLEGMLGVYELNQTDLLADVFFWAYARSCQQYVAVERHMVDPDPFRLRHRQALGQVVAEIVRAPMAPTVQTVEQHMPNSVPQAERARFTELVLKEFRSLHAGNAIRFGLRPTEFAAWQEAWQGFPE